MLRRGVLLVLALSGAAAFTEAVRGGTNDTELLPSFHSSDRCFACHNGMTTSSGKDFSLGLEWRAEMMANSSRDPYWQGSVRRETLDHPESKAAIEDECTICHMPIVRYEAKLRGEKGELFGHLPFDPAKPKNAVAEDGVTCTVCHQISSKGLGTAESYVGNFVIDPPLSQNDRPEYGPYAIAPGQMHIMSSSTGGYTPTQGTHIAESGICGSCHTLITKALGEGGKELATFYEQMPYPEWLHSDYAGKQSCQACHMPEINEPAQIASVLGVERTGVRQHTFVGGNFLLERILNQYRSELAVTALPEELEHANRNTIEFLRTQAARVSLTDVERSGALLNATVVVQNLTGHKLPTAYPSRRAWLHFVVRDGNGKVVFESGRLRADGSIVGNDNDDDPLRYEPHYRAITRWDQVEIYEDIMKDQAGHPTTGLLHAVGYLKDNRVLPTGFDKKTAAAEIAVIGGAADDPSFAAGEDRVRYSVWAGNAQGPLRVEAELIYQPVGFRWAHNLLNYDAMEPQRFVRYYAAEASNSGIVLARAEAAN
ncbi:MAG TPA: hypothetical protein VMT56_03105 [Candidatus Bathyarchaeia archaeon]|nr:hypothetical protein [Candidatus Bathyarchaeia archaeon]